MNKNMATSKNIQTRRLEGVVVSDKMEKTRVVRVDTVKLQTKYKKRYKFSKNYKADDAKNEYKIGDKVVIEQVRPLSRDKYFRIIKKI